MKNKKVSILLFMCAVMGYVSSTIMFVLDNIRNGAIYLCLATAWLCLGVYYLKGNKKK